LNYWQNASKIERSKTSTKNPSRLLIFNQLLAMETPVESIESLMERAETYGNTTYKLSKLIALETVTMVFTSLITRVSIVIMISMFALVFNIGIALLLGEVFGKTYYGFFIVAIFYLIAGIIMNTYLHQWIKKPISELIIVQALK
jgi:hypothetical protein